MPYEVTAKDHVRRRKSLASLQHALQSEVAKQVTRKAWLQRSLEDVKAVLSYQFNAQIAASLTRNQQAVGKPRTKRWRIPHVVRFLPSLGLFLPLKEGAQILADEGQWVALLKGDGRDGFVTSAAVDTVLGKIRIGELFVGIRDGTPCVVGQALVPGRAMERGRQLKVARIVQRW